MKILFLSTAFLMAGGSLSAAAHDQYPDPSASQDTGEKIPSFYFTGNQEDFFRSHGISSDALPPVLPSYSSELPPAYTQGYQGVSESIATCPPYSLADMPSLEGLPIPVGNLPQIEHMIAAGQRRADENWQNEEGTEEHLLAMGAEPSRELLYAGHVRHADFPEHVRRSPRRDSLGELEPVSDHVPKVLDYASILTQNQFKEPHISVDALPYPMTINNLETIFVPCIAQGDYAPLVNFFYVQLDLLDIKKQDPAVAWLERNNDDPICAYLFLRWHYYHVAPHTLSPDAIRQLWFKRYLAELLIEFDARAMNVDNAAINAHTHIRDNINQFVYRLDGWMKGFPKTADALNNAASLLEKMFVTTYSFPDLHGNPFWLYTAYVQSSYMGFSHNFMYVKPDAEQEPLKSLMYAHLKEAFLIDELKTKAASLIKRLREQAAGLA
jgi:hypothetical protein